MKIKSIILEELSKYYVDLSEEGIAEDYPATFNKEEFYKLRSFAERIRYCTAHLAKIAAGSGRVVFKIDEKTVLKLAKNPKGVAQNLQEAQMGQDYYLTSIVTAVYNSDPNDLWIESELANKIKPNRFKELTGVDLDSTRNYLRFKEDENKGKRPRPESYSLRPEDLEILNENEFLSSMLDLMFNYNLMSGDLGRLSSYGEVNREGHPTVVVVDYGFTDEVYQDHYAPKPMAHRW